MASRLRIELAAARTQSLSVAEIARHLDDRFKLLTRGARTALGRHQTLRAAIDWSFDLLDDAEQRVLARASVFAGGFTLDAATAVCDSPTMTAIEMLDLVDGLVRRSMLIAEEDATTTRYRMLETIRQYAAERLEADERRGRNQPGAPRLVRLVRARGRRTAPRPRRRRLGCKHGVVSSTTSELRCTSRSRSVISTLRTTLLASAPIGALWDNRLGASMRRARRRGVAPILGEPDHPVSAALLSLLALDAALRFAGDEAVELAERACVVARRHDDWLRTGPWLAWLLSSLIANRHEMVMVAAREGLTRAIADDDAFSVAEWDAQLGLAHWMAGDIDEAQRLTELGLALAEDIGADNLIMRNAFVRGVSLLVPGSDSTVALGHFKRAVRLGERLGGNVLYGAAAWGIFLSNSGNENLNTAALVRELARNLPTAMFLVDADGALEYYNEHAEIILGQPFDETRPIPLMVWTTAFQSSDEAARAMPTDELPLFIAWRDRVPCRRSFLVQRIDGVTRRISVTAVPLFGSHGVFVGAAALFWEQ